MSAATCVGCHEPLGSDRAETWEGLQHVGCALASADETLVRRLLESVMRGLEEDRGAIRRAELEIEALRSGALARLRTWTADCLPFPLRRQLLAYLEVSETRTLEDVQRDVENLLQELSDA